MRGVLISMLIIACAGCANQKLEDGPPIHVKVGSVSLCVGREFIDSNQLHDALAKSAPFSGYPYNRVYLYLFSRELSGFTAETRQGEVSGEYEKRPDWTRIMIWSDDNPQRNYEFDSAIQEYYEPNWTLDSGFRSHRRKRDCVETGWLKGDKECLSDEIKYGHPVDPAAIFGCQRSRCWLKALQEQNGVWFSYTFPQMYIADWPALQKRVRERIHNWVTDRSCIV